MSSVTVNLGVYAWGSNSQGQMGIAPQPGPAMMRVQYNHLLPVTALKNKNIVQIAGGGYHSLALTGRCRIRCTMIDTNASQMPVRFMPSEQEDTDNLARATKAIS